MAAGSLIKLLLRQQCLLVEALQVTKRAVIISSINGVILFCTEPAEGCLERYFGTKAGARHELPEKIRTWICPPDSAAVGGPLDTISPLVVDFETGRLLVFSVPNRNNDHRLLLLEDRDIRPSAQRLQSALGLTAREGEILFWLAQGKVNAGIATLLGIKIPTVEKHIEHIMAKLNVETRTTAACCAHEALNGHHLWEEALAINRPIQTPSLPVAQPAPNRQSSGQT
jgi:DNA-binding CsgD family transcriptional regulator